MSMFLGASKLRCCVMGNNQVFPNNVWNECDRHCDEKEGGILLEFKRQPRARDEENKEISQTQRGDEEGCPTEKGEAESVKERNKEGRHCRGWGRQNNKTETR